MILPPSELDPNVSAESLKEHVCDALEDYESEGPSISASEWDALNQQLLAFFGAKSVAEFERKKKDITVRRNTDTGDIDLFWGDGDSCLMAVDPDELGITIRAKLFGNDA